VLVKNCDKILFKNGKEVMGLEVGMRCGGVMELKQMLFVLDHGID
jgi:hypothetical protein